uniref:Putative transcription factor ILR3-like isoform X2 n=1 Tax=Davidia involucrata TaxID=16924 RepID=A0A5B7B1U4_DAVIN
MEIESAENSNWLFDYGLMEDISAVSGGGFTEPPAAVTGFNWPSQALDGSSNVSGEIDCSFGDPEGLKEAGSRKRVRSETCSASGSKAGREKLRRDRLNERFLELGSILDPGRPPKADKGAILSDAVRMVTQLRSGAQKLKESNEDLQEKIKELKAEKNELRDEKQRLKTDKEKLEQQVKAMSAQPGFLPHPSAMPAAFAAQGQAAGNKLLPFMSYPGVAMWQFMPPAVVDTSQDHVLRPPVA